MNNTELEISDIIEAALREDVGPEDITTAAIFSASDKAEGEFIVKAEGVIAGHEIARRVFAALSPEIRYEIVVPDGSFVTKGTVVARVAGGTAPLLTGERTALNFMQRCSGIATAVHAYVEKIQGTGAQLLDTRKTVPGLRAVDKLSVKLGGGANHRIGLFDMFLIKDNHIQAAGSLSEAVRRCQAFRDKKYPGYKIEVEAESLAQVTEAAPLGVDVIMLDNMSPALMKEAIQIIAGRAKTEASGNITLDTIREVAESGVDFISTGAVTHSVRALDISLELQLL